MMGSPPLVSIVMPSYNQAAYLEQAICSVLDQDYPNLELLVIDGLSTDGSVEIIRKYASRLAWWVSEKDHGQAEAINKGFKQARGEIIGWLNSDDLYQPGSIRAAVEALAASPQVGMVFGDVLAINAAGETTNIMHYGNWGLEDLMQFQIIGQPGVFMRRSTLVEAGFLEEKFHFMLDHQLWLRMAQVAPMKHLDCVLAAARFHAEAKNVALASAFGEEAYRVVDWMKNQAGLAERFQRNRRKILAGAHRMNARYLLDGGQPGPALRSYLRSLVNYPPIAAREAHRIVFAAASLFVNVDRLRAAYLRLRRRLVTGNVHPSRRV
jgi:glycosyltransferase involved in cell wall biosynthesis